MKNSKQRFRTLEHFLLGFVSDLGVSEFEFPTIGTPLYVKERESL
jgi:hypothetical protein